MNSIRTSLGLSGLFFIVFMLDVVLGSLSAQGSFLTDVQEAFVVFLATCAFVASMSFAEKRAKTQ